MLASFFEFLRAQFHTLNHHHQITPVYTQRRRIFIKRGQLEPARFQLLVVYHHAGIFHVEDLHDVPTTVNENENTAIANILPHRLIDYSTQGIKALAQTFFKYLSQTHNLKHYPHVYRHRVQIVLKRLVEMEHTLSLKGKQECEDG